ncbi:MAG: hypothetical protein M1822_002770 [Bathelium mastoideum]|nr:MAG: hypothetical protein M1822_002770 [Bathelium mastoideum]
MASEASASSTDRKKNKKPYHISKADLQLDEYIEERNSRSPSLLVQKAYNHLKHSRQFHVYIILQIGAAIIGYGQVMLVVGLFWAMIANTGKRKDGEMSAYSLFNKNVEAMAGSTNMEALEQELRTRGV